MSNEKNNWDVSVSKKKIYIKTLFIFNFVISNNFIINYSIYVLYCKKLLIYINN